MVLRLPGRRLLTALLLYPAILFSETLNEGAAAHQKMVEVLAEIGRNTNQTNPYLGSKRMEEAKLRFEALTLQSPVAEQYGALVELGSTELEQGFEREAIGHLKQAYELTKIYPTEPAASMSLLQLLATAHLRLAETENCCATPNVESCIFPLQGDALHARREGSANAMAYLRTIIETYNLPQETQAEVLWLGQIAAMTLGMEVPGAPELKRIEPADPNFPQLTNIAREAGVDTFSLAGGAVAEDFDGDGWIDLMTSAWDPNAPIKYFRNRRNQTFEDLSDQLNLEGITGGLNLKPADFDNDGDIDVLVLRGAWLREEGRHPNSLLRNDGVAEDGAIRFVDVAYQVGIAEPAYPTQVAEWADMDLDGDLDLFVGNETKTTNYPCQLFRNDGPNEDGVFTFVDIAKEAGVETFTYVKGAAWGDIDNDRYPDLLVSGLNGPNRLFRNLGNNTFEDIAPTTGVDGPSNSFPCWFWDFDNDGNLDPFLTNYRFSAAEFLYYYQGLQLPDDILPGLFRNDGKGGFRNVAREAGFDGPMMPMGSNFADLTNNGFPDAYLGTGTPAFSSIVPNLLFVNDNGRFADRTVEARVGHLQKGHAVSFADIDRDGDLDIFEQMGGAFPGDGYYDALFENPGFNRNWLNVKLIGVESNSRGVGCRIRADYTEILPFGIKAKRQLHTVMNTGGSFGANPLEAHLGLGFAKKVDRLEIQWPKTGKTDVYENLSVNEWIEIREGAESWKKRTIAPAAAGD